MAKCEDCENSDLFYRTLVGSLQWAKWVEYNEKKLRKGKCKWDTVESGELGLISEEHFQAFLKFVIQNNLTKTNAKEMD